MLNLRNHNQSISLLVILLSGCTTPLLVNPLVKPEESSPFPELYGMYRSITPTDETEETSDTVQLIHVGPAGENYPMGFFRIVSTEHHNIGDPKFGFFLGVGFAVKEGDYFLVHLPVHDNDFVTNHPYHFQDEQWSPDYVKGYLVLKIKRTEAGLEMAFMNPDFIEEALKTRQLEGKIKALDYHILTNKPANKECLITSDTEDVRNFIRKNIQGNLFESTIFYYKQVQ